jgi:hypothetical protein
MKLTGLMTNDLLSRVTMTADLRTIAPGDLLVSLHTADPGLTGANEAGGTFYRRLSPTMALSASGVITNAARLKWFNRQGETVIERTLAYSDNFNRANVGYCSGALSIGANWKAHTGCFGIQSNQLKMGSNYSFPCRMNWTENGVVPMNGQYSIIRLRSWKQRPQMGPVAMVPALDRVLGGYVTRVQPSGGAIGGYVRLYRRTTLLATFGGINNPMSSWMITAIPFVDHTFIQIQQDGHTWIEYDDYAAERLSIGYAGLDKNNDTNLGNNNTSGYDTFWDDWESGGAILNTEGGGGSPDITITHLGFWTTDGRFLGSGVLTFAVHCNVNQVFVIDVGLLNISMSGGIVAYRDKNLDRSLGGINFTSAPLQFSLHTASPGTTGANEIENSRLEVPTTVWEINTDGTISNSTSILFPEIATNTVTHLGVWDLDGVFLFGFALSSSINATLPLQTIRFLANRIKFRILQTEPAFANGTIVATGTSTANFAGTAVQSSVLSATGQAIVSLDGKSVRRGVLNAAGVATVSLVGKKTQSGVLAAAGVGAASFKSLKGWYLKRHYVQATEGNVTEINVTNLAATDFLIITRNVTLSIAGVIFARASTDNGSTYRSTSGDYQAVAAAGTEAASTTLGQDHATSVTAARSGMIFGLGLDNGHWPFIKSGGGADPKLFVQSTSTINAIKIVPNNGGNITGGEILLFLK